MPAICHVSAGDEVAGGGVAAVLATAGVAAAIVGVAGVGSGSPPHPASATIHQQPSAAQRRR